MMKISVSLLLNPFGMNGNYCPPANFSTVPSGPEGNGSLRSAYNPEYNTF